MPQLDFITYLNQYLWIISILSLCIIVMCVTLLPNMKYVLGSRFIESEQFNYKRQHEFSTLKKLLSS